MTADELFNELQDYYVEKGKFPSIQEFTIHTRLPYDTVSKVYKRWLNQGKLIKKGNGFDFYKEDTNKLFSEKKEQKPDNYKIVKSKDEKIEKKNKPKIPIIKIGLKSIIGIIGVILTLCSIHFTFNFNSLSMNKFWAFCLSFSIVSFMAIAFTMANTMKKKILKTFVILLWFLGFVYSVFTAVSGQYNDFRKYLSIDKSEAVENKKTLYENQLKIYTQKQKELLHWRDQETEYSLNPDLKLENPGTWRNIQSGIKKLEESETKIEELQEKIINLTDEDVVSNETVYSWLCKILKISSDKLHFIIILFPSIFIDLCSGICLMYTFGKKNN